MKKKHNISKTKNVKKSTTYLKKAIKYLISFTLTALLAVIVATLFFQILSKYYAFASKNSLTLYDLSILSSFSGGVFGVMIAKFGTVMRSINKAFDRFAKKEGGSK